MAFANIQLPVVLTALLMTASSAAGEIAASVTPGYNFTNALLQVTGVESGTVTLNDTSNRQVASCAIASSPCRLDPTLTAGGIYSFAITAGDESLCGEILAANWCDAFTEESVTVDDNVYTIANALPDNRVVAVEQTFSFTEGLDEYDLAELATGGGSTMIAAYTNSASGGEMQWRVWLGDTAKTGIDGWTQLHGAAPAENRQQVLRTTFDLTDSSCPRVRYQVKADGDSGFANLTDGDGNCWQALVGTASTLDKIGIYGNASLSSMTGRVSSVNLYRGGDGNEYADWSAAVSHGPLTLLTNVADSEVAEIPGETEVTLDLAGYDWLQKSLRISDNGILTVTNATLSDGCVEIATLATNENGRLLIAGGLWEDVRYGESLLPDYAFCRLTNDVACNGLTFAYRAKKAQTMAIGSETVKIDDDFIATNIPDWKEMTAEQRVEALREKGANGLGKIESYVLTLDPNDANSVPDVTIAQESPSGKAAISLGNVRVNEGCGIPVGFALRSASTLDGIKGADRGALQGSPAFEVELPATDGNVQFYSIDIQFGEDEP